MTPDELKTRIEGATSTELVQLLVNDVRAWKDAQLNELTQQLNAVPQRISDALADVEKERDEAKALLAEARAAWDARDLGRIQNLVESVDKSETQKRLDELEAEIAEDKAELARDEAERERLKSQT